MNALHVDKRQQITLWIRKIRKCSSQVLISPYCYDCRFTGKTKSKTLIAFPAEVHKRGIISIDKPLEEIEILDIIKLYTRIKKD